MTTNAELRALAEKATPGPWEVIGATLIAHIDSQNGATVAAASEPRFGNVVRYHEPSLTSPDWDELCANAAYIAAAHPARIIELLDASGSKDRRIDFLEKFRDAKTLVIVAKDDELTALRDKLDLAMRFIDRVAVHASSHPWIMQMSQEAEATLAQLKEQP